MIHLDTNYIVGAVTPGSPESAQLQVWLSSGEIVSVSSIAWAEFLCGPLSSASAAAARAFVPTPEPFLPEDAEMAADLYNATGRRKGSLADCMIAAAAIRHKADLATANRSDFQRFVPHGLQLK